MVTKNWHKRGNYRVDMDSFSGYKYHWSYSTLIGITFPNGEVVAAINQWSVTTAKHLGYFSKKEERVPHDEVQNIYDFLTTRGTSAHEWGRFTPGFRLWHITKYFARCQKAMTAEQASCLRWASQLQMTLELLQTHCKLKELRGLIWNHVWTVSTNR